jgi:uncharacterized SAM-binding protein YcdF (DUF218 family)
MNALLQALGLESLKAFIGPLLLPPVPLVLLVLAGAWLLPRRRRTGWALVGAGCVGIWLAGTAAAGHWIQQVLLRPPPVLTASQVQALAAAPNTAVLVLGGGSSPMRQEYGTADLHPRSIERLRYGAYLARSTGLPLAFSGGFGWGAVPGAPQTSEAALAARTLQQEFGLTLRWQEDRSRDTRENAALSLPVLQAAGVRRIVLVTHAYHMPRALRAFEQAAAAHGGGVQITPAPMGVPADGPLRALDWVPSHSGTEHTRLAIHELLGRWLGA